MWCRTKTLMIILLLKMVATLYNARILQLGCHYHLHGDPTVSPAMYTHSLRHLKTEV